MSGYKYPFSSTRPQPLADQSYAPYSNYPTGHAVPPAVSIPTQTLPNPRANRTIHVHIRVHLTDGPNSPDETYTLMLRLRSNASGVLGGLLPPCSGPATGDQKNYDQAPQLQTLNEILVSHGLPSGILHTRVAWAAEVVACGPKDVKTWHHESSRSYHRKWGPTDQPPKTRVTFNEDSSTILGHFMHVKGDNGRHLRFWLSGLFLWYPKDPQNRDGPGENGDLPWVVGVEMW